MSVLGLCFRDFAYVARDKNTRVLKCHVFRCDTPAAAIATSLHEICSKVGAIIVTTSALMSLSAALKLVIKLYFGQRKKKKDNSWVFFVLFWGVFVGVIIQSYF